MANGREVWQKRNAEKDKQQGCQEANEGSLSLDEAMETNVSATKAGTVFYLYDANAVSVVEQCVLLHESMNERQSRPFSVAGEESGPFPETEGGKK